MLQGPKKLFVLSFIACLMAMPASLRTFAAAEENSTEQNLQPKALNHAGVYSLREIEPGLTGAGIKYAVVSRSITYIDDEPQNDYRPVVEHNCFKGRQFVFHDQGTPQPSFSPHSTAICSILFGEDPEAYNPELGRFYYQGAVPQAEADVYEFWDFLINNVFNHQPPDADIITASIGSAYEGWWTRGIESLAEHYGLIVVAGIGNGLESEDPLFYPASSANIIGVGVVDSIDTGDLATQLSQFSLAYPKHSSLGPTVEGRCKPDIVAPGNCLAADVNESYSYEPTGDWSSYSTPVVSGAVGLLVQKARQDPTLSDAVSPEGGNCVIKAILMNSATKLAYWHKGLLEKDDDHEVPLDYIQGAGMLNAVGAYRNLISGQNKPGNVSTSGWDLNELNESENPQNVYRMTLADSSDKFITATLVWNRHYSREYPFEAIPEADSDLRLELWGLDKENPNKAYLLDYSDSEVDNVEHIYFQADANYTNYEVVVSVKPGQQAKAQRYGLAWSASEAESLDDILWYDLNADGVVDDSDTMVFLENWIASIQSPDSYIIGDINDNGVFDIDDAYIFMKREKHQAD